jgi:hypothetical protein
MIRNKKAQVWVETVVYTLIAFLMISLVLFYVKPQIEKTRDKAVIEQSLDIMKSLDLEILGMNYGDKRTKEIKIKQGKLIINGIEDTISFEIPSKFQFSELDKKITDGGIEITTVKTADAYNVKLFKNYSAGSNKYNLTIYDKEELRTLNPAGTLHEIQLENKGLQNRGTTNERIRIDIST